MHDAVAGIVARLDAHFAADGIAFVAAHRDRWYARMREPAQMTTRPTDAAIGGSLYANRPRGPDARRFERFANEMQMLLHAAPENAAREATGLAPCNGVWLWDVAAARNPSPACASRRVRRRRQRRRSRARDGHGHRWRGAHARHRGGTGGVGRRARVACVRRDPHRDRARTGDAGNVWRRRCERAGARGGRVARRARRRVSRWSPTATPRTAGTRRRRAHGSASRRRGAAYRSSSPANEHRAFVPMTPRARPPRAGCAPGRTGRRRHRSRAGADLRRARRVRARRARHELRRAAASVAADGRGGRRRAPGDGDRARRADRHRRRLRRRWRHRLRARRARRCAAMGARVDFIVPNRFVHGYGLTPEIVALAAAGDPALIVTVDNGIASVDGVRAAAQRGIDVLITDHHLPGAVLPSPAIIVNPNQPGCTFPSRNLAGVGVMFYVLLATRALLARRRARGRPRGRAAEPRGAARSRRAGHGGRRGAARRHQPRAGRAGARAHPQGRRATGHCRAVRRRQPRHGARQRLRPGLRRRAANQRRGPPRRHDGRHPLPARRRRARGRRARRALERAQHASGAPSRRRCATPRWPRSRASTPPRSPPRIRSASSTRRGTRAWSASSPRASRRRYHRPAIVFAPGDDGELKGSGRSIAGFHLRDALERVASASPGLLRRFGGHAMAAGLTLDAADFAALRHRVRGGRARMAHACAADAHARDRWRAGRRGAHARPRPRHRIRRMGPGVPAAAFRRRIRRGRAAGGRRQPLEAATRRRRRRGATRCCSGMPRRCPRASMPPFGPRWTVIKEWKRSLSSSSIGLTPPIRPARADPRRRSRLQQPATDDSPDGSGVRFAGRNYCIDLYRISRCPLRATPGHPAVGVSLCDAIFRATVARVWPARTPSGCAVFGMGRGTRNMRLQHKVSIITGGGQGIGRATSVKFAQEGSRVAVCDINRVPADETAAAIRDSRRRRAGVRSRRHRQGQHRAHGRGGDGGLGPHRHAGQQCRHRAGRPPREDDRRAVRARDRRQPEGRLQLHQGRRRHHARAELGLHPQCVVDRGLCTAISARPTTRPPSSR